MATVLRIEFSQLFLDELLEMESYVGRDNSRRGRAFTQAVFDFAYSVVGTLPLAYPTYRHPLLPHVLLRRAIFQRSYALLYQVSDDAIVFVYFHHTRRDISQIAVGL